MKYFVLLCSFFIFSHNQFCSMQKRPTVMKSTVLEQLIGMARSVDPHPDTIECKDIFKILHNGICKKDSQYQRYIVIAQDGVLFNKEQACITYVEDTAIEVSMTNVLDFQFNAMFEDACNPGGGYYYLGVNDL